MAFPLNQPLLASWLLYQIVIVTTDLLLTGQDPENEARFFNETPTNASSGGQQTTPAPRITVVFVEVAGPPSTSVASDPLTAWNELQRLRDAIGDGAAFALVGLVVSCVGLPECHALLGEARCLAFAHVFVVLMLVVVVPKLSFLVKA